MSGATAAVGVRAPRLGGGDGDGVRGVVLLRLADPFLDALLLGHVPRDGLGAEVVLGHDGGGGGGGGKEKNMGCLRVCFESNVRTCPGSGTCFLSVTTP